MWIIPAIDILDGQCVRLYRGSYQSAQVYHSDPAEVARAFTNVGARHLHLVDLDAARGQGRNNRRILEEIRRAFPYELEMGGGIRAEEDIRQLIGSGIDRLVLGTILAREPDLVAEWCARFGKSLWGGIDALNGKVKVSGWEQDGGLEDVVLAKQAAEMGLGGLVYTSISRDGTLEGPDIERTNRTADASGLPVILSGGISKIQDIMALDQGRHPGVAGVIIGRAIYENKIDLAQLLRDYPEKLPTEPQ